MPSATQTRRRARASTLLVFALLVTMVAVIPGALAVHGDESDFELDGNVARDDPDRLDWVDFVEAGDDGNASRISPLDADAAAAGFIVSSASPDHYGGGPDRTTFTQGSKDTLDVSEWVCTRSNNVGNKVDIVNAYSAAQRKDGDLILYYGAEIREPEGNSNIGVWFLKNEDVGCEAPATGRAATPFSGTHEDGDVLVVSAFTNGGRTANISVYEWKGSGASGGLQLRGDFVDVSCDGLAPEIPDLACAVANTEAVTTPWHSPDKSNANSPLAPNTFFEGGVNITKLLYPEDGPDPEPGAECFSQFLVNTRSSQSLTATIFDFTREQFNVCGSLTIEKETDPAGYDLDFDFELKGDGTDEEFQLNAATPSTSTTTFSNLPAGSYTVEEVDIPVGWDLDDIECTDASGSEVGTVVGDTVTVDIGIEGSVTCVFKNKQRGSILIEKTFGAGAPAAGDEPVFTVNEPGDGVVGDVPPGDHVATMTLTTVGTGDDTSYYYCADDLVVDDEYWISETHAPSGYDEVDDRAVDAASGTCADRLAQTPVVVDATITNDPSPVDLTVTKYKLTLNEDATATEETTTPLAGFVFTLYEGDDDTGDVVATSTTGTNGQTAFSSGILEVGDQYTVCETGVPTDQEGYWTAPDEPCETFTAALGSDETFSFYNAPKADVEISFDNVTGYTSATIECETAAGVAVDSDTFAATSDGGTLELDKLDLGDYVCTIEIRNGGSPPPAD